MFWRASSPKMKNMHFGSCSADGGKGDPIGLGKLEFGRFRLQEGGEFGRGEAVGKAIAGACRLARRERLELLQRLAKQPRRGVRLLHAQAQIAIGDLDAGAQQDALASALGCGGPYGL